MIRMLLVVISLLLLSGCFPSEYEDISNNLEYSALVGSRIELLEEMYIHAVSMKESYNQVIDVYIITGKPGFSGKEVLSKDTLSAGTIILVEKVLECKSCLYDDIKYEVKLVGHTLVDKKIIYLSDIGNKYLTETVNGTVIFSSNLFSIRH